LYTGKGERLYKRKLMYIATYNRKNKNLAQPWAQWTWNMKTEMNKAIMYVFRSIIQKNRDEAFMFGIREGAPFYCSEGDLTKAICKRMIGW
jgi:hypothetical protein